MSNPRDNKTDSEIAREGLYKVYTYAVEDNDGCKLWFRTESDRAEFVATFEEWARVNGSPVQFTVSA